MSDADKRNLEYWDNYYADYSIIKIEDNNWLNMYNDVFDKTNMPIIDLGCGNGNNIPFLLGKGRGVIPCDGASTAIRNVEKRFPGINAAYCFNMLDKFPLNNNMTDLIVSDLSLHYFTREDTIRILKELKRILVNNGHILLRVNSLNDNNYMNELVSEVEPHLYLTRDGRYKRFFSQEDIYDMFNMFDIKNIREMSTYKYTLEKKLYAVDLKNHK